MKKLLWISQRADICAKRAGCHCLHYFLSMVMLPVITMCVVPDRVSADQAAGMPKVLRTGFLQRVFYETDPRDAKAAIEVQGREVSRALGLNTPPKVNLYPDMPAMADALRRGELELVTMPSVEYLRIREAIPLIPGFVGANNNGLGTRYVIIVRSDSDIRTFTDLKGRSILLPPVVRHELSHIWLDVLLMKAGKGESSHFFRQVKESPKLSHAVMGVFLRQADAAVVTRSGLDTSRQLNPQLETQLTVLAESRNLSDGVTCLIPGTPEKFRNNLSKEIMRLNNTSGGRQMYTIFQSSGITPFKPEHLEGLEELLHEYDRLKQKTTKRK
jgi:ABC-type phosphate/phosphonate transport system substrate-binding protein